MMKMSKFFLSLIIFSYSTFHLTVSAQQATSKFTNIQDSNDQDSTALAIDARVLSRRFLERLPFRGESQDYYALFSGTVNQDYRGTDLLHVRGSRHDEIGYTLEGIDLRNAYTGLSMFRIIPEALESLTLQASPSVSMGPAPVVLQRRLRRGRGNFKLSLGDA